MSLRLDGRNPLAYMGVNPNQPPQLIVNKRQPATTDAQNVTLGTLWLIPEQDAPAASMELWSLLSLTGNVASWVQLYPGSGGGGTTSFITDSGTANEVGGDITIHGGSNIGTTGSGSTITVNLDNTVSISGSMTAGTGVTATTGNITTTAGQVNSGTSMSAATTVTAGTGVEVTTGDVSLLSGNITLPSTNGAGTEGEVIINGTRFISNYSNTTAVGNNASNTTHTGLFGTAFGNSVLSNLTSGASNSGFGNGALEDVTSGGNNSCFGYVAGGNITTGSGNTAMGDGALALLTNGSDNVAYGPDSLGVAITGSNNIALGNSAGINYASSEGSNIVIGNTGTVSESHVIRIGTQGSGSAQQDSTYIAGIYQSSVGATNEFVIIDSNGKLGSSAINSFSATLSAAVSNVTGDGTLYTIIWDSEIFDINSNFNPATGVFTVPVTGVYSFTFSCFMQGFLNTHILGNMRIVAGAKTYLQNEGNYYALSELQSGNNNVAQSFTIVVSLTAADTVYCQTQVSGGTKVIDISATAVDPRSTFSGYLIS